MRKNLRNLSRLINYKRFKLVNPAIQLKLHAKQRDCFLSDATEILYGGAAGGGKSHAMRVVAVAFAFAIPGIQIYLFRRIFSDLVKNHIEGPSGFRALLAPWINSKYIRITDEEITFWNGSKIYLCHCQHEKDVIKYQGTEMHLLLIDELTHFTEKIYRFLRSRVRIGSLVVPKEYKEKLPRIISGSNPGGVGHEFVKQMFIDDCAPMQIRRMEDEEGGMLRQFIPARLVDNPTMTANDPLYAAKLIGLGGALAKAMLEGDWDAIEGAYFDTYDKNKHVIDSFTIPNEWYRIRAFDWGFSRPFCVLWGAVSDGSFVFINGVRRQFPKGAIIIYREFYGTTGKANTGIKMNAPDIAKNIREMQVGEKMNDQVADPAIFNISSGESIAEQMAKNKVFWRPADNKRINGWQQIRSRLTGVDGRPMLYIVRDCHNLIRTLPIMQYDITKPEDLDTDLEDHAMDTLRYLAMARPMVISIPPTPLEAAEQWKKDFNPHNVRRKLLKKKKKTYE